MNRSELAMIQAMVMSNDTPSTEKRSRTYKPKGLPGKQWTSKKSRGLIAKKSKQNNRRGN